MCRLDLKINLLFYIVFFNPFTNLQCHTKDIILNNKLFTGDTISKAISTSDNSVGIAKADSRDGGKSTSVTDSGQAISTSQGDKSIADSRADSGKSAIADAQTDSTGGSAIANSINNSYSKAQSVNRGNSYSSANDNSIANSLAEGNSDATALSDNNSQSSAQARSTSFNVNINDNSNNSVSNTNSNAYSGALATAADNSKANADSNSIAGSIGVALNGGSADAESNSNALSEAHAANQGYANSIADSNSIANSVADSDYNSVKSDSSVIAVSKAGETDNSITTFIKNINADTINNTENLQLNYPTPNGDSNKISINIAKILIDQGNSDLPKLAKPLYITWEDVYFNRYPDRYHYNTIIKPELTLNKDFETFQNNLISENQSEIVSLVTNTINLTKVDNGHISNINIIKWVNLNFAASDIGMGPQGDIYAAGLDGYLYYYYAKENKWEKIEGDFDLSNISRLDVGLDATPFVVTFSGETYFLNCEHKWEKLPGCTRDIGTNRAGEIFKIGCERRPGGYRIYKLICNYRCNKCMRCNRYRRKCETCYTYESDRRKCEWFNMDGGGLKIDVHPNGNPFIINDTGAILFYDGTDWKNIPGIHGLDLTVSNEGHVYFIGTDYNVYVISPKVYIENYLDVTITKLIGEQSTFSAIAITSGPFSQPLIIGNEQQVYSSSKQGYN